MSSHWDPPHPEGRPSVYAPRWAREDRRRRDVLLDYDGDGDEEIADYGNERRPRAAWESRSDIVGSTDPRRGFGANDRRDDWAVSSTEDMGAPLDPPDAEPPRSLQIRHSQGMLGAVGRLILAVSIAAVVALIIAGKFNDWFNMAGAERPAATAIAAPQSGGDQPIAPHLQLVAEQSNLRVSGEELPLGLAVEGPLEGVALVIAGLPSGSRLSTGGEFGVGSWRVAAVDIGRTALRRPRGFAGPMNLIAELRLPDETVMDRRSLRFEWDSSPGAAAAAPSPVAAAPAVAIDGPAQSRPAAEQINRPTPQLDAATIAALIKRAEEFIAVGDISAARVLLRRAAEAHDSRAAFTLATTYDPLALEKLGVRGVVADVEMARKCYNKAREFGSSEAQARLEMLATVR